MIPVANNQRKSRERQRQRQKYQYNTTQVQGSKLTNAQWFNSAVDCTYRQNSFLQNYATLYIYQVLLKDNSSALHLLLLLFFLTRKPVFSHYSLSENVCHFNFVSHDPVQKRLTFLHFLASSFQNAIFCEVLWLTSREKNYTSK